MTSCPREKRKRDSNAAEVDLDEYYDPELKEPAVKTVAQAVALAEPLKDFAQYYEHEELSLTLRKVNDILHEIKLQASKYQKTITDFFFLLDIHNYVKSFSYKESSIKVYCTSLKVHHRHFMGICLVVIAFPFKIVFNKI